MDTPDCPYCGLTPVDRHLLAQSFQLLLDHRAVPEDMTDIVERLADPDAAFTQPIVYADIIDD